jgi:hypothetical protein
LGLNLSPHQDFEVRAKENRTLKKGVGTRSMPTPFFSVWMYLVAAVFIVVGVARLPRKNED